MPVEETEAVVETALETECTGMIWVAKGWGEVREMEGKEEFGWTKDDMDFIGIRDGIGWIAVMLTGGVKGLARLKSDAARVRLFFSPFPSAVGPSFADGVLAREAGLLGPFVPNLCTAPAEELLTGVETPERLTVTALARAPMVRDTGPGVGVAGATLLGGLPICGILTFSDTMLGVRVFLNTLTRCVLSALSGLKKLGET